MFTAAVVLLVVYVVASLVFWDWKRSVPYPKQSFGVAVATGAFEGAAIALAVLVLVR